MDQRVSSVVHLVLQAAYSTNSLLLKLLHFSICGVSYDQIVKVLALLRFSLLLPIYRAVTGGLLDFLVSFFSDCTLSVALCFIFSVNLFDI